ncbi:hypothetical protein DNTS_016988 [Danionella cerebrum]|uniref:Unconventional myosin-IXb-like n=1 Tax=Danionella cerebrum TaxID=2873325 RepID=A0A553R9U1_9TELE|nr:hypothetical protein DNTS_016988 [Danionella translucida]
MNISNGKVTNSQDEPYCNLQVYPRLSNCKPGQCCNFRVPKETTAATVIKTALTTLGLDSSKPYVLVEVQEFGGEEWVLQASDLPVQRVLLWPRKAQDKHPQSDGYFFTLQEESCDGSIQYDVMTSVRQEKVAQGLVTRGFVTQHPQEYGDLCNLSELTEETILETLRHRFHKQKIYTFASNILIAVNPFKFLPIYNPRYVKMYENHTLGKLEPHIFAIADAAFHSMLNKGVNQCIVISGESGSGKTQSTNFLIHCLTALSQKGYTSGVERIILGAGPVLEAFGNAKTAYNNNSSRFGKFIQVNYLESGVVRGAVVEKYLLEKCRLVSRGKTERNYHVFYYILIGASEEEREEFKLLQPQDYHYLKEEIPFLEDQAEMTHEFKRLHQAMEMVGFLPPTKKQIFSVLSAILYLGNVTYEPKQAGEGLKVGPDHVLSALSELLKAITARDSMAKSLYSALFDWIVLRINHSLLNKRDLEESVPCLSIGVLDIFGFEDFKTNSFEQFCINYANEQLQYYCNQHIFTLEQEEYLAEGITWHAVDYPDNIGCISLFSKKPTGLFYLLDEESNFPQATDITLLEKFKQLHQDNPFFVQTPVREPAFVILHFAGKVKYQIKDFREKNTDHMRPDIVALLRSSECSYLRQLIGANPVAVFRWGILRATIRTLAVFNKAGRSWAEKHPDQTKRCSRLSFGDMRRANYAVERLKSLSRIDFSFDRTEEDPLEAFEDIFATFENRKDLHDKVLQSLKHFEVEVPHKMRLSTISVRKSRLFSQKNKPNRNKQLIPKNLIDSHSLKFIVALTQHNRVSRSLLHLHTKKKPPSISAQFQASLSKLLETLRKAEPFFVRCIRSNGDKREMHFDDALVLQQLRYTGMLQTVRIRRSGYGAKFTFKEFISQFRVLLPKEIPTPQEDIANLLMKIGLPSSSFQIGRTKVFLKETERQILQEALHKEVMRRIIILQRWFRACLMRKQYLRGRKGIITIQRSWRYFRKTYRSRAAVVIQTAWRRSKERAEYLKQREKLKAQGQNELDKIKTEEKGAKPLPPPPDESRLPDDQKKKEPKAQFNTDAKPQVTAQPTPGVTKQLTIKPDHISQDEPGKRCSRERQPSPSGLPRPVSLPLNMSQSGYDETQHTVQLQRHNKPSRLREKPEKWKERSSEAARMENVSEETLRLQHQRKIGLWKRGISQSLDNVARISSSESDTSSKNEVLIENRKRLRHKRRLAHPRSGLKFDDLDLSDLEYWSFPLPPISPATPIQSGIHGVLEKGSQSPVEADGCFGVPHRSPSEENPASITPEKTGFLKYFRKRLTPQEGNITMTRTLLEKEEQASASHSNSPRAKKSSTYPGPRRNPTIQISRATRVQEKWNASLDREITDPRELRQLDDFLGNKMNDLSTRTKELSETENIFLFATKQFRENIKSLYSTSNPNIGYKVLMSGYQTKVASLAGPKRASEVPMVVNLFQSVLDGFIRGELKRLDGEPSKIKERNRRKSKRDTCVESTLGHLFSTYQVTIMQSCDQCTSYIWGMEKAFMCSSCKMVCHKKCLSKITINCTTHCARKRDGEQILHFGVPVCVLINTTESVPYVIEKMLVHVEMTGLYTEGIYRKSGSACRAKELHQKLEKDFPEASERVRAIYRKIEELPSSNISTLERLIFHLVQVAKEEPHNRMSANSLAIVFAPCILRCPDSSDPLLSMKDINKTTLCVEILINEQSRRYNQKMEDIQQLESAEALAMKTLKLRRQNTISNPKSDTTPMDGASLEIDKNLVERIVSIKKEKNDLALTLREFDQDCSDTENMDSPTLASSESLLEDLYLSLGMEATALLKPEKHAEHPDPKHYPKTGIKQTSKNLNQSRLASRRDGVQSMCIVQRQDVSGSPTSSMSSGNQSKRRFSELDIPFIDDDDDDA